MLIKDVRLSYAASGTTDIELSYDIKEDKECYKGPERLIRGSLREPFHISPQYLVAPGSASPGCLAPSHNLSWTVVDATYSNNTRFNEWVGPSRGRWFNLDIRNNAGNFLVKCRLLLDSNPYSAPTKFSTNCWVDPYKSSQAPQGFGNIWTDFDFNESDYSISVTQTWFCEDFASSES
jgi:hypothetical protein